MRVVIGRAFEVTAVPRPILDPKLHMRSIYHTLQYNSSPKPNTVFQNGDRLRHEGAKLTSNQSWEMTYSLFKSRQTESKGLQRQKVL